MFLYVFNSLTHKKLTFFNSNPSIGIKFANVTVLYS